MMLSGACGVLVGYLGCMSPWAMDINLWLFPAFLDESAYPELLFLVVLWLSIVVWIFGTMFRHWPRAKRR